MPDIFEVDENCIVTEFRTHDAVFRNLQFQDKILKLELRFDDSMTFIELSGVEFLRIPELVPNGILLSCYSFPLTKCPSHLKDEIDLESARQYLDSGEFQVFYIDGTMGFEILAFHRWGHAKEVPQPGEI
jgi:hypothetical protein